MALPRGEGAMVFSMGKGAPASQRGEEARATAPITVAPITVASLLLLPSPSIPSLSVLSPMLPSPSLPSPLLLLPSLPSPFIKEELWLLSGERELELLPWKPLVEEGETRGRRTVTLLRG